VARHGSKHKVRRKQSASEPIRASGVDGRRGRAADPPPRRCPDTATVPGPLIETRPSGQLRRSAGCGRSRAGRTVSPRPAQATAPRSHAGGGPAASRTTPSRRWPASCSASGGSSALTIGRRASSPCRSSSPCAARFLSAPSPGAQATVAAGRPGGGGEGPARTADPMGQRARAARSPEGRVESRTRCPGSVTRDRLRRGVRPSDGAPGLRPDPSSPAATK